MNTANSAKVDSTPAMIKSNTHLDLMRPQTDLTLKRKPFKMAQKNRLVNCYFLVGTQTTWQVDKLFNLHTSD